MTAIQTTFVRGFSFRIFAGVASGNAFPRFILLAGRFHLNLLTVRNSQIGSQFLVPRGIFVGERIKWNLLPIFLFDGLFLNINRERFGWTSGTVYRSIFAQTVKTLGQNLRGSTLVNLILLIPRMRTLRTKSFRTLVLVI